MFVIAVALLFIFIFMFKYLPGLMKFMKHLSSIPNAPGMSRILFLGHLPLLFSIKKQEKCSLTAAMLVFINNVLKERPDLALNGVFKLYLGVLPVIMITSPEAAGVLLKRSTLEKSFIYKSFHVFMRGMVDMNGPEYRYHRKVFSQAFDLQILCDLPDIVSKRAKELITQLQTQIKGHNGVVKDISKPLLRTSMKTILTSAGVDYDVGRFAEEDFNDQVIDDFMRIEKFFTARCLQPWLLIDLLIPLFDYGRKALNASRRLIQVTNDLFEGMKNSMKDENNNARQGNNFIKKKESYLKIMIRENERNPNLFTRDDVLGEFRTFIAAGSDSVSLTQTWTLHYLGHHPEAQEKIFKELDEVFGDSDRDASMDDIKKLKYLEAAVKEGMRLSPPICGFARDADDDITFQSNDGKDLTIPKSATLFIFPYFVQRDPRHWKDPETFDLMRFFNNNDRHEHSFIPFSAGLRSCLAKRYAMTEVIGLLAALFRRFSVKSLNDLGSIRSNPQITNHPSDPVSMQFIKRSSALTMHAVDQISDLTF